MADANIDPSSSLHYWENIDPDVNGMLGGFPHISKVDLQGSRAFLVKLGLGRKANAGRKVERAVDCGAGIGRVTSGLLLSIAETVDIVEPIAKFSSALLETPGIGEIYTCGLESFVPSPGTKYDLIWNQWCVGHLTDAQLITYLTNCKGWLSDGGFIVVKENLVGKAGDGGEREDVFDEVDSCVTRTDAKFRAIFTEAGLEIRKTELQNGLPRELYAVRMYALVPV